MFIFIYVGVQPKSAATANEPKLTTSNRCHPGLLVDVFNVTVVPDQLRLSQ